MKLHSNIYGWDYVWRDFADEKGGKVIQDDKQSGSPVMAIHIPVPDTRDMLTIKPWLPSGKKAFEATFATISFPSKDDFAFAVWTEHKIDQLHKVLGMQDVRVGEDKFDKRFIVQANNEILVKQLFSDSKLCDLLMEQNTCELRLLPDACDHFPDHLIPAGHSVILFAADQLVDKFENLEAIANILQLVLERIHATLDVPGHGDAGGPAEQSTSSRRRLHSPLLD